MAIQFARSKTSYLPFYGGAKGKYLQIIQDDKGDTISETVITDLSKVPDEVKAEAEETPSEIFSENLKNIKNSAQKLVELQESALKKGKVSDEDKKKYNFQLGVLGEAATNLAKLSDKNGQDLNSIFNGSAKKNCDGDDVGDESEDSETVQAEGTNETSVAEAKPVGLAVAGEGGVASSKPVGTAVVGPGGVAIARPIGTAIAGVDPESIGIGFKGNHPPLH